MPLDTLREAFAQLASLEQRVVLGPSQDGGYYLVGMNQPMPEIFSGMTWSHDRVLAQTTEKLAEWASLLACYRLGSISIRSRISNDCGRSAIHRASRNEKNLGFPAACQSF